MLAFCIYIYFGITTN